MPKQKRNKIKERRKKTILANEIDRNINKVRNHAAIFFTFNKSIQWDAKYLAEAEEISLQISEINQPIFLVLFTGEGEDVFAFLW